MINDMEIKQEIIVTDKQKVKEMLTSLREPCGNFEVVLIDEVKWCRRISILGTYNHDKKTITLYLKRIKSSKDIIRISIHEYAHHFIRGHGRNFWNCYFELLEIAEKKGFYSCNINKSDRLVNITKMVKQYNLIKNIKKFKRLSSNLQYFFCIIYELCFQIDVDFQYYTVKYLEMDWYKGKNPLLTYEKFEKKLNRITLPDEKETDEFLTKIFAHYCKREYKIAHPKKCRKAQILEF